MNNKNNEQTAGFVPVNVIIVCVTALIVTLLMLLVSSSFEEILKLTANEPLRVWSLFAITLIVFFTVYVFVTSMERKHTEQQKNLMIIYSSMLITLGLIILSYKFVNVYIAPVTLLSVIVTVFVGRKVAILCNGLFSSLLLLEYMLVSGSTAKLLSAEVLSGVVAMIVGYFIVFFLSKTATRARYLGTGLGIALLSLPLSFASALLIGNTLIAAVTAMAWTFVGNLIAIAIFLVFLPIFESVFKVCTDFKLSEYCNFRVKLLRDLAEKAPGTFNHSLMVGVLAESCALAIGENPQLARTCAYYHDVGKIKTPEFFAENQKNGRNPHDDLIPEVSANKITSHTLIGYDMLKNKGYPDEIAGVCLEHHGTMPVSYFYRKADKISDGNAELEKFSYAGPKPTTKIAAIIMLCDASEAAARAAVHGTQLSDVVDSIFNERMNYGQFDICPITISDLKIIKETIVEVLSGIYHSRVSYVPKL